MVKYEHAGCATLLSYGHVFPNNPHFIIEVHSMPENETTPETPVVIINAPIDAPVEPEPTTEPTEPTIEQRITEYMAECERRFGEHDERLRNLERPAGAGDPTETSGPQTENQPNGDTPPTPEPERPPNATHWYFKRVGE